MVAVAGEEEVASVVVAVDATIAAVSTPLVLSSTGMEIGDYELL